MATLITDTSTPQSSTPIIDLDMTAVILRITRESWLTVSEHSYH